MYAVIRIRCVYIRDQKNGPSFSPEGIAKIPVSHRVVDQLSPHHDSQFLAFSTEVPIRRNEEIIKVVHPLLPQR